MTIAPYLQYVSLFLLIPHLNPKNTRYKKQGKMSCGEAEDPASISPELLVFLGLPTWPRDKETAYSAGAQEMV